MKDIKLIDLSSIEYKVDCIVKASYLSGKALNSYELAQLDEYMRMINNSIQLGVM